MVFVAVASFKELKSKGRELVEVNSEKIVLFFPEGKIYALNSICPHKGGPLDGGELVEEEIICPLHCFEFNIKTGVCLNPLSFSVRNYLVKLENDEISIAVD